MASKWAKKLRERVLRCPTVDQQLEALYAAAEEVARVAYREADDALDISECMSLSVFVKRVLDKLGR